MKTGCFGREQSVFVAAKHKSSQIYAFYFILQSGRSYFLIFIILVSPLISVVFQTDIQGFTKEPI